MCANRSASSKQGAANATGLATSQHWSGTNATCQWCAPPLLITGELSKSILVNQTVMLENQTVILWDLSRGQKSHKNRLFGVSGVMGINGVLQAALAPSSESFFQLQGEL